MMQHNEMLRIGWMWARVSLAGSGKVFRARDALIIGDVPGDPDQPPTEKTGISQTWRYVNAESLPDSSMTVRNRLRAATATCSSSTSSPTTQSSQTRLVYTSFGGNLLSGLWYPSLMNPYSPCSSMTAENVCTDVQEKYWWCKSAIAVWLRQRHGFRCFFVPWSDTSECYWW